MENFEKIALQKIYHPVVLYKLKLMIKRLNAVAEKNILLERKTTRKRRREKKKSERL